MSVDRPTMPVPSNNGRDGVPENLDVLQALQEMLVKMSRIEVSKYINKMAVIMLL